LALARCRPNEAAAVHRFDLHLADVRRAPRACTTGPLEDLLRMSTILAELAFQRGHADLSRMADDAVSAAGVSGAPRPLLPRLLGTTAHTSWQHGDLDDAEHRSRAALKAAHKLGEPSLARDALEALAKRRGLPRRPPDGADPRGPRRRLGRGGR
jgi:hypothetical protein